MSEQEPKRERRAKARHRDVIFGCIEERLAICAADIGTFPGSHLDRIRELLDELRRSLKGDAE